MLVAIFSNIAMSIFLKPTVTTLSYNLCRSGTSLVADPVGGVVCASRNLFLNEREGL